MLKAIETGGIKNLRMRSSSQRGLVNVKDYISQDIIIGLSLPFKDDEFVNRNKDKVDKIFMYASSYNWQIF